jgi:hypothetical protein
MRLGQIGRGTHDLASCENRMFGRKADAGPIGELGERCSQFGMVWSRPLIHMWQALPLYLDRAQSIAFDVLCCMMIWECWHSRFHLWESTNRITPLISEGHTRSNHLLCISFWETSIYSSHLDWAHTTLRRRQNEELIRCCVLSFITLCTRLTISVDLLLSPQIFLTQSGCQY